VAGYALVRQWGGLLRAYGLSSRRRVRLASGFLSGGSLWLTLLRLAAGAAVWVLVGNSVAWAARCAALEAFMVLESSCSCPDLGVAYPDLLWFHLSVVRGGVAGDTMDGGHYSGECLARCGRYR
jgi:hypothetical protein